MADKFRKLKLQELNRLSVEDYAETEKIPVIVVLDNIRSLHNVGSVFRSSDAFRIREVWLCGYTPQPPHREIQKTALGATESVKWRYFETADEVIAELGKRSISIYPLEQTEDSTSLEDFTFKTNKMHALILGNEVDGVSEEFIEHAEEVIEIPQEGTKHSLNVSVAAGILLWEAFHQLR